MEKTKNATLSENAEQTRATQMKYHRPRFIRNEPLGLPRGSVRALITLIALGMYAMALGITLFSSSMGKTLIIPESLTSIVLAVIAFYFGTRSGGKDVEGNEIEVTGNFSGEADSVSGTKNMSKH